MLLFCCYTPAHEVLYREIFLPSVPAGFEIQPHIIEESGPGDFLSPEFLSCIRKKIDLVLKSIEQNSGRLIVWSDVDIRFFDLVPRDLQMAVEVSGKDGIGQKFTQFNEIASLNRQCLPARLWSILRRIPAKIRPRP